MRQAYLILFFLFLFCSCRKGIEDTYTVKTVEDAAIVVDGNNNEDMWSSSAPINSFTNPWDKKVTPKTSVQFIADANFLYFFFESYDSMLVVNEKFGSERSVEKGDRVELFFSEDKDMRKYYCFEIDPKARVLAYSAEYYRKFDFKWDPPVGFEVSSQLTKEGYTVEGAIPINFIKMLALDNQIYLGAYRAEFSLDGKGDIVENWLTWMNPSTQEPDFHVPKSLGKLICESF